MLGAPRAFASADRRLLEECILPFHARRQTALAVLFVGTRAYTSAYETLFAGHRFITMDIDPAAARHGSSQRHVVACASRACDHFEAESFDLIVFNGVFGWGLDERASVEAAVEGFHRLLREGGELVVGWNRIGRHRPFEFDELGALEAFRRVAFPPLGRAVVDVPGSNRHRFEFFAKPAR